MSRTAFRIPVGLLLAVFGVAGTMNGLWMILAPLHWYNTIPAGVPDFGPYNPHFVRDVGCAYLTMGLALGWGLVSPRLRAALVGVAAMFAVLHALVHVFDTASGHVGPSHWIMDLPGVYLPAAILLAVFRSSAREVGPG